MAKYVPTPAAIRAGCEREQARWSPDTRRRREAASPGRLRDLRSTVREPVPHRVCPPS